MIKNDIYLTLYQKLIESGANKELLDALILTVRDIQIERIMNCLNQLKPDA